MRAIVVGAGPVATHLLRRLGDVWVVTVVDRSSRRLEALREVRSVPVVEGDGSSLVVLKRAGLQGADALVAATEDDDVNLEICRLGRDAGLLRLAAVLNDPDRRAEYRDLGANAVSPHSLAARRIESGLETRRVTSVPFADGRAEAIELRIEGDSPVRGKALRDLHAANWIVGVILRGDRLIIPHGETVFETGDLVTVVGAGADYAEIVRNFTLGEGRFPLDFGKRVMVALESEGDLNGLFSEAMHLVRGSRASSLLVVHRNPDGIRDEIASGRVADLVRRAPQVAEGVEVRLRPVESRPSRVLGSIPGNESVGVIVLRAGDARGLGARNRVAEAVRLVRQTSRPVLLARGGGPYRRILVPARRTATGRAAVRAAIDLARYSKAELHALAVADPVFISGPGAAEDARHSIGWLEEEASASGVTVTGRIERGNPLKLLGQVASEADLLVLGVGRKGRPAFPARRTSASVLLVPA